MEDNELWLDLAVTEAGVAATSAWFPHLARSDAQSIVVHDPTDGARLTCIDLE